MPRARRGLFLPHAQGKTTRSAPQADYLSLAGNTNVQMVKEFWIWLSLDLVICSTFFAKRKSRKVTYVSGGRRAEADGIELAWHLSGQDGEEC
ncbi:unnamed protein product [Heligmosomoides polygyrus]|uniref:Uncharacterized protein n=1 Tax=Heligmosomoides polygyrus TaxID=6339 RepID=A0A183GE48_HELPZ|nr:unnamed protein product [Heligmosomoides polygyrus]